METETETAKEVEKVVSETEGLPKAIVRRVVKDTLSRISGSESDVKVHNDAFIALSESARIFIHYLSATANDICKESKRQTINADDVLKAIEEIEFSEFVGPLKDSLREFRQKNASKKSGATENKEQKNKRKAEQEPSKKDKSKEKKVDKDKK